MHTRIGFPGLKFPKRIFDEICQTIGAQCSETGGLIGGNPLSGQVTRFFFDSDAKCTTTTYVRSERVNLVIHDWNEAGDNTLGIIHSHPRGSPEPSEADVDFAFRILKHPANAHLNHFWLGIVQSAADGPFSMRLFGVTRQIGKTLFELPFEVVQTSPFPIPSKTYKEIFCRVCTSYDLARLFNSELIAVGCGGAASFIEDMARSGLRHFILIDPDNVQSSNIATGQFYHSEISRPKVEVLKSRILDINPLAEVTALHHALDHFSDQELRSMVFDGKWSADVEARLLCGFTDAFWPQARVARLGLNFGIPTMTAQVYRGGAGAEISFMEPTVHHQCIRCILSRRYDAYLKNGFKNDATSEGSQYFATPRLNSTKQIIAMSLLHYGTPHPFWGPMLARIGQRNFVQIRCDADIGSKLGLSNFDQAFAGAAPDNIFFDETIWRPQHPENASNGYSAPCPDCGGSGHLTDCIGKFEDTGLIQE